MRKSNWNTYLTTSFTTDVAHDQQSAGGVHHHQVRKTRDGWQHRILQVNGMFSAASPTISLGSIEGQSAYDTAREAEDRDNRRRQAAADLGRSKSPAKAAAARTNGVKGGRPKGIARNTSAEVRYSVVRIGPTRRVLGHYSTQEKANAARARYLSRPHGSGIGPMVGVYRLEPGECLRAD